MKRGDVWWAELGRSAGSEADKVCPVVIVGRTSASEAAVRAGRGVVTVVPLTSNVSKVYAMQVLVDGNEAGLPQASKAQAEQVRSIDVARVRRQCGHLPEATMHALDQALRLHLNL